MTFPYVYRWKPTLVRPLDRKGQPCRVLVRGSRNSCLLQFEDGFLVVTSRNAIRRRTQ